MAKKGYPGAMIVFEGVDGSGKTTNVEHLKNLIEQTGYEVITTREPGGSDNAEKLRAVALSSPMDPLAELLVFAAARAEHMTTTIIPALQAGKVVICDRFAMSTHAYQGCGRGLQAEVRQLNKLVLRDFRPDYLLFFDVTLEESKARLKKRRKTDIFDEAEMAFKERVFRGFQKAYAFYADDFARRAVAIDAMKTPEGVKEDVEAWVRRQFFPSMLVHTFAYGGKLPDMDKAIAFSMGSPELSKDFWNSTLGESLLARLQREGRQGAEVSNG